MRQHALFSLLALVAVACTCVCAPLSAQDTVQVRRTEPAKGDPADWPVLKHYDQQHLGRIALPVGGIGTGTVSLGGRGDLRDWEIMNRPAKGFVPQRGAFGPFFAVFVKTPDGRTTARAIEGPIELSAYEASHGSTTANHGLPRFRECSFAAAYPLGQVMLSDADVPVDVRLEAFNPLVPADPETSGIPVAILRYVLRNKTDQRLEASICGTLPNFVGMDGSQQKRDWKGDPVVVGSRHNRNRYRQGQHVKGLFMDSEGVDSKAPAWGTIALATTAQTETTHRLSWIQGGWGNSPLDFWDDFSADGQLDERPPTGEDTPMASLAVPVVVPPNGSAALTFLIGWHFPNRITWTPAGNEEDRIGNYYTSQYADAWDVVEKVAAHLGQLESETVRFVRTFCKSDLPETVKEAALFNLSTLRSQTCFRTPDGRFYGFEGCCNTKGCCQGSCTHVWNYEQATAFTFGTLAKSMRDVEFTYATDDDGLMSFRVNLPLGRARQFGKAAADGQMGCIMKAYRDWQLSGDDRMLETLWPHVKKAVEFCWIEGGWDADKDGVMEGCQHNTMDVEYYGPNPQMGIWYLGALRAAEEMARHVGDEAFATTCHDLFQRGKVWIDANLFNGEYYEHQIRPPKDKSQIAPSLLIGMGAKDPTQPDYQLGAGCLVDQLVGQFTAHVCGLGYLVDPAHVRQTLSSIMKYNYRTSLYDHFNCMRSFALGGESALLMASYPKDRPKNPFPYFSEVMTGFEYAAAVGMLYEGQTDEGLKCIRNIRDRYDGRKRSPFNEAECGHHYARAMASWAAILALTDFHYSGVDESMTFTSKAGTYFWSNGYAWGACTIAPKTQGAGVRLSVIKGQLALERFKLKGVGQRRFEKTVELDSGSEIAFSIAP